MTTINIKDDHGAEGDGTTDDTQAIQDAFDAASSGDTVFFPGGNYIISDTIEFGSDFDIEGKDGDESKLTVDDGVVIDAVNWGQSDSFRDRQAMLAPEGKGSERQTLVTDTTIKSLTLDWNNAEMDGNSSPTPLWIDSADHITAENVTVVNAESADWSDAPSGSDGRGTCIGVTHAEHISIDNCWVGTSNYRSIAILNPSEIVEVTNTTIDTAQVWRHGAEVGALDDFPEPPTTVTFDNCTWITDATRGQADMFTIHGGADITVKNSDFYLVESGSNIEDKGAIKLIADPHDLTDVTLENNSLTTDGDLDHDMTAFLVGDDRDPLVANITMRNNTVEGDWHTGVKITDEVDGVNTEYNLFNASNTYDVSDGADNIDLGPEGPFVTAGNIAHVTATIDNKGDDEGDQTITLKRNGDVVDDEENVQIAASDSDTVVLDWQTDSGDVGEHTITAESDDDSDSITVEVTEPDV